MRFAISMLRLMAFTPSMRQASSVEEISQSRFFNSSSLNIRRTGFVHTAELVMAQVNASQHGRGDFVIQLDARKSHAAGGFEEICQGGEVFHRPHGGERSIVNGSRLRGGTRRKNIQQTGQVGDNVIRYKVRMVILFQLYLARSRAG